MRQILIDYAKQRQAQKRGGGIQKVTLGEVHALFEGELPLAGESAENLLALNEALARLAQIDERLGLIVECRFFGEMTIEETAAVLGVSPATVKRSWTTARAWLYRELKETS
jgi:RNA polymerase sigma factor (TIGR02999 family)